MNCNEINTNGQLAAAEAHIDTLGWSLAKTKAAGARWAEVARDCGFTPNGHDGVASLTVHLTPGDKDKFEAARSLMHRLLGRCPVTRAGSTWGDDGVGADIALERGCLTINQSGVAKNFAAGVR